MKKTLLSLLAAALVALCFPLMADAAVYTVSWGEFDGGRLSVCTGVPASLFANGGEVSEGSTLYVNATPSSGYYLSSLTANGEDILLSRKFTVKGNTTLDATFEAIPSGSCIVRYLSSRLADIQVYNGQDRIPSEGIVPSGTSVTVNVVPASDVVIGGITVGNTPFTNGSSTVVTGETSINYSLSSIDVTINYSYYYENGGLSIMTMSDGIPMNTIQPGVEGDNVLPTMTEMWAFAGPDPGYELESITVNGVSQPIERLVIENAIFGTMEYWGSKLFTLCEPTMDIVATFKVDDGTGPGGVSGLAAVPVTAKIAYDSAAAMLSADEDATIFDMSGQAVLSVKAGTTVSLDGLPVGIYVVKGSTTTLKIAK